MIKLLIGYKEKFNGYKTIGISKDLSEIDEGECSEIRGVDICNYVHYTEIEKYIRELCSKLCTNGTIIIGGTDLRYVMMNPSCQDMIELNSILFPVNKVQGFYNINYIAELLVKNNIRITDKFIDSSSFTITGVSRNN